MAHDKKPHLYKNSEGYNDPTPYAAEKHMMAQIRGKQARVAGGYFENIISASCDYYLSRGKGLRWVAGAQTQD